MKPVSTYSPITIIWIEDNPLQQITVEAGIPEFKFTGDQMGLEKYFSLRILQHPEEIRQYLSLCREIEDSHGPTALGGIDRVVPEAVVFDYKLFDNVRINQVGPFPIHYIKKTESLRKCVNPCYDLVEFLNRNGGRRSADDWSRPDYTEADFVNRVYAPDDLNESERKGIIGNLTDDEFGLFAGVELIRRFRNHPCVGVPATENKVNRKNLHPLSRFYEWLNEPEYTTALNRKARGDKGWNASLGDAMAILRERILEMSRTGRILVSYHSLRDIAKSDSVLEQSIPIRSDFGFRQLPLAGLFIDQYSVDPEGSGRKWIDDLLTAIVKVDTNVENAIEVSEELWGTFSRDFGERINLSALRYRELEGEELSSDDREALTRLSGQFTDPTGDVSETSILTLLEGVGNGDPTFRLTVLHLITKASIQLAKIRRASKYDKRFLYGELDQDEVLNLFFPVVQWKKGEWLLPIHKKSDKDDLRENLQKKLLGKSNLRGVKRWWDPSNWADASECHLLRNVFVDDIDYFPPWLISRSSTGD